MGGIGDERSSEALRLSSSSFKMPLGCANPFLSRLEPKATRSFHTSGRDNNCSFHDDKRKLKRDRSSELYVRLFGSVLAYLVVGRRARCRRQCCDHSLELLLALHHSAYIHVDYRYSLHSYL